MIIDSSHGFDKKLVPNDPGVYMFKDNGGEIIYCGKAKSLRSRVSSYFSSPNGLAIKTRHLVSKIGSIDWIVVRSEVEALLLENKMIKEHSPKYNINLKDSKTFAYIALTKDAFPRIMASRRADAKLETFGPYTDGAKRRELQRLVVNIFKIRTCRSMPKRACLNYHIGICTAPCIGLVNSEQYKNQVDRARLFLNGEYVQTAKSLREQMHEASEGRRYEKAMELRNQLDSIELISKRQVVDHERSYDQDVIAFRRLGERAIVVQMGIRRGVLLGKKDFEMDYQENFEQEFLRAFYSSNQIPREIIVNEKCWADDQEKDAMEQFLSRLRGAGVTIILPIKGEKRELLSLAEMNIEANMKHDGALIDLQNELNLPTLPIVIESFDVSNTGDEHIVSGMVRFVNAKPDKGGYRKFKITTVDGANDFASIQEAVYRRYSRLKEEGAKMPDLILIDGGAEQLASAMKSLERLGIFVPAIGLAKRLEEIYLPGEQFPRSFKNNGRMMLLLRRIRDATHDFSLSYNRKRRQMKMRDEFSK